MRGDQLHTEAWNRTMLISGSHWVSDCVIRGPGSWPALSRPTPVPVLMLQPVPNICISLSPLAVFRHHFVEECCFLYSECHSLSMWQNPIHPSKSCLGVTETAFLLLVWERILRWCPSLSCSVLAALRRERVFPWPLYRVRLAHVPDWWSLSENPPGPREILLYLRNQN